jgi:hypothetical protein
VKGGGGFVVPLFFFSKNFLFVCLFFSLGRGEERNKTTPKFILVYMYVYLVEEVCNGCGLSSMC